MGQRKAKFADRQKDEGQCKDTKPFEFKMDYHYYQDEIYSMGSYYNGHNLRQMKRYAYILWRIGTAYEDLKKYSLVYGSNEQIDNILKLTRELCVHADQVYKELATFPLDSKYSSKACFGTEQERRNHARRHLTVDELDHMAVHRKYLIRLDEWGREHREAVSLEDYNQWPFMGFFISNAELFVSWGHWLEYLFVSDMEGGEDTGLDLGNLRQLIDKGIKYAPVLKDFVNCQKELV